MQLLLLVFLFECKVFVLSQDKPDQIPDDNQTVPVERTASLIVLPPLILGYDDLYEDSTEDITQTDKKKLKKHVTDITELKKKRDEISEEKQEKINKIHELVHGTEDKGAKLDGIHGIVQEGRKRLEGADDGHHSETNYQKVVLN